VPEEIVGRVGVVCPPAAAMTSGADEHLASHDVHGEECNHKNGVEQSR
jgi:hypothetical protein